MIVRVQGGCYGRKPRHQPFDRRFSWIGAFKKPLDFAHFAHDEALAAPFDQRRAAEEEAVFGAGEADIVDGSFVQPPESNRATFVTKNVTIVNEKETAALLGVGHDGRRAVP